MATRTNTSDPEVMKARIQKGRSGNLTFPSDIHSHPVFFSINMREYKSMVSVKSDFKSIENTKISGTTVFGGEAVTVGGTYIHLPLPSRGLHDSFNIEYQDLAMMALGGVGATINDIINDPNKIAGAATGIFGGLAQKLLSAGAASVGGLFGTDAAEIARGATELATGYVSNPNIAVLFKGVGIRQHRFSWKMIAKNVTEAQNIQRIVTNLKFYSLPKKTFGANFSLSYPHIAYLYLVGPINNGLITFSEKGTFIKDINVVFNGQDTATFFASKTFNTVNNKNDAGRTGGFFLAPVEVDLTITFMERSIVTREDIELGELSVRN